MAVLSSHPQRFSQNRTSDDIYVYLASVTWCRRIRMRWSVLKLYSIGVKSGFNRGLLQFGSLSQEVVVKLSLGAYIELHWSLNGILQVITVTFRCGYLKYVALDLVKKI